MSKQKKRKQKQAEILGRAIVGLSIKLTDRIDQQQVTINLLEANLITAFKRIEELEMR